VNARGETPRHQLGLGPTTLQAERRTPAKAGVTSSILAIVSCYGCSPSTGTNASTFLAAPSQACVSQQPGTHSCSEFHFRSASSSFARRPASQPAHRNKARCGLSSDAHAGATRRRRAHRHAGAVRRTSVSLAFCCRRTLRAQAASHSSADKSRRTACTTVCTLEHQKLRKPLTN